MKHKSVTAIVTFPIYIKLSPLDLKDKTIKEIKARIIDLAEDMLSDNTLDIQGFITTCTIKSLVKPAPTIKKTSFSYSAKKAEDLSGVSYMDTEDDESDTNMDKFGNTVVKRTICNDSI